MRNAELRITSESLAGVANVMYRQRNETRYFSTSYHIVLLAEFNARQTWVSSEH